ncbi:hypothetical protein lbkm_2366 [Lachnospiraceae bacterium KM106-2]|nr:hypothetical protein lbkm_2366 [Lachnospiraceae bacterium KM106-2]
MRKIKNYGLIFCLALFIFLIAESSTSQAATKISTKKVVMTTGKKKQLKITGSKTKAV